MESESNNQKGPEDKDSQPAIEIDEFKLKRYIQQLKDNQNLAMGALGGVAGAILGAALWAIITAATKVQIGWMAVGVGFLAGYGVRISGKGIDNSFGIVGAVLALLGCLAGNLLGVCIWISQQEGVPLGDVLAQLNPETAVHVLKATFDFMDLFFYGIAVYAGYRFAFRRITEEELLKLTK